MISLEQIKKLGTKYQTNELNVMREYLQHLFLSYFYQLPESNGIYFKGGTSFRLVYQSMRFSEDLDFSTNKKDIPKIEDYLLQVLEKIEKENIPSKVKEAKTTSEGYLFIVDFMLLNRTIPIKVEISFREKGNQGEIVTVTSDLVSPYTLVILEEKQLISQKIRALLARKKPRDFYDLYFILRKNLPILQKNTVLKEVLKVLNSTNINFGTELKQYLPKSHWTIIKDLKKALEKEITRFI